MINVFFYGRWPQKKRFEQYTNDVLNHFFKNKLVREVDVHLKMASKQTDLGYCHGDKNEVYIDSCRSHPNYLGDYTVDDVAKTLAHELVHAKQYLRGEIKPTDNVWHRTGTCYDEASYRQLPWEHEAYMMEDFLHNLYWKKQRYLDLTYEVFHGKKKKTNKS